MASRIHPLVGQADPPSMRMDVAKLVSAHRTDMPDPTIAVQRVAFGTSVHRGSSFDRSFNAGHVLAITQAICHHRKAQGIGGPLFLGIDTHALSAPACASARQVLAANDVDVRLATNDEFAPTPAVSHAIVPTRQRADVPTRRCRPRRLPAVRDLVRGRDTRFPEELDRRQSGYAPEYGVKPVTEQITIGQLAAAAVNVEPVRYYQRRCLLAVPDHPAGSIGRYAAAVLTRLRFI